MLFSTVPGYFVVHDTFHKHAEESLAHCSYFCIGLLESSADAQSPVPIVLIQDQIISAPNLGDLPYSHPYHNPLSYILLENRFENGCGNIL